MAEALLDSNVLIAASDEDHIHHLASAALFETSSRGQYAVAAHSYAEAYSNMTRRDRVAPFHWPAERALDALDRIAAHTTLVGLTPAQSLDAVRRYAEGGGVGPRLYDHLIGEAARHAGSRRLITWNTGHMRGLFPDLEVLTPEEVAATGV